MGYLKALWWVAVVSQRCGGVHCSHGLGWSIQENVFSFYPSTTLPDWLLSVPAPASCNCTQPGWMPRSHPTSSSSHDLLPHLCHPCHELPYCSKLVV
jgi:hypothetical protein